MVIESRRRRLPRCYCWEDAMVIESRRQQRRHHHHHHHHQRRRRHHQCHLWHRELWQVLLICRSLSGASDQEVRAVQSQVY